MTSTKRRRPAPEPAPSRRSLLWPIVGAVAAVALIVAVIVSMGETGDVDDEAQAGSPVVGGEPLPRFDGSALDPAVGSAAPVVTGAGFDGAAVSIEADGTPKAIVFLAHWCPHCQSEVPVVQEWLDDGGLPAGTELIGVSTGTDPNRPNYPPQTWLEGEGWSAPLVVDDGVGSVANAFGLNAFPFWVLVDADGNVAARVSGGVDVNAVGEALAALAAAGS